jgi:cell division transport system permease protein
VRLVGIGGVSLLGLTSFLIVVTIIGIKITAKRQAIHIMRIIGATKWYIKGPFMIEGLLYGLLGSLLGWSLMMAGLLYITPWLRNFLGSVPLLPFPPQLFAIQLGLGTAIAMLIGAFAAVVAAQRFIKR